MNGFAEAGLRKLALKTTAVTRDDPTARLNGIMAFSRI
jgi:hypothetical protein